MPYTKADIPKIKKLLQKTYADIDDYAAGVFISRFNKGFFKGGEAQGFKSGYSALNRLGYKKHQGEMFGRRMEPPLSVGARLLWDNVKTCLDWRGVSPSSVHAYADNTGFYIGAPAPLVPVVRATVADSVIPPGVIVEEGKTSPGAVGEGWFVRFSSPDLTALGGTRPRTHYYHPLGQHGREIMDQHRPARFGETPTNLITETDVASVFGGPIGQGFGPHGTATFMPGGQYPPGHPIPEGTCPWTGEPREGRGRWLGSWNRQGRGWGPPTEFGADASIVPRLEKWDRFDWLTPRGPSVRYTYGVKGGRRTKAFYSVTPTSWSKGYEVHVTASHGSFPLTARGGEADAQGDHFRTPQQAAKAARLHANNIFGQDLPYDPDLDPEAVTQWHAGTRDMRAMQLVQALGPNIMNFQRRLEPGGDLYMASSGDLAQAGAGAGVNPQLLASLRTFMYAYPYFGAEAKEEPYKGAKGDAMIPLLAISIGGIVGIGYLMKWTKGLK